MRSPGHTSRSVRRVLAAAGVEVITLAQVRAGGVAHDGVVVRTTTHTGPTGPTGLTTTVDPYRARVVPEAGLAALRTLAAAYGARLEPSRTFSPRGAGWAIEWPP